MNKSDQVLLAVAAVLLGLGSLIAWWAYVRQEATVVFTLGGGLSAIGLLVVISEGLAAMVHAGTRRWRRSR